MFCPKCGTENPDGSQSCASCSAFLPPVTSQPAGYHIKTSGWAIASLVCGILTLFTCGITAIFAIIFGIIALLSINNNQSSLKGNGLALTGIITGFVFPAILLPVLFFTLSFAAIPIIQNPRAQAQKIVSANNMKQIVMGLIIYSENYNDILPEDLDNEELVKIMGFSSMENASNVFENPRKPPEFTGPGYIYIPHGKVDANNPDKLAVIYDNPQFCKDGVNVGFLDGHVEYLKKDKFQSIIKHTYERLNQPPPDINFIEDK